MGRLLITDFGNFHVRQKKERLSRNFQRKEFLKVRARRTVGFKASEVLGGGLMGG
jgi:nucleoid DNA-binding protein